jgi:predicted regulator of amino acid metabolism with ACT domain
MLDLICEKNTKIGKLVIELAEAKDHFEKLISSVDSPLAKRGIRLRIGQLDRFIKEALA